MKKNQKLVRTAIRKAKVASRIRASFLHGMILKIARAIPSLEFFKQKNQHLHEPHF